MPYRKTTFLNENYYHVYNRGVEKKDIFTNSSDYQRFLEILYYYQYADPKPSFSTYKRFKIINFYLNPKIVDVVSYCLMPNHFHLLLKQSQEGGVQELIRKMLNSYAKYFNTKYKRVGHLLQGEFKDVPIENEEQLLHLSRYIHLNPYVSGLTNDLDTYPYSSYPEYLGKTIKNLCIKESVLSHFKNATAYKEFVDDQKEYALSLELLKHHVFDEE